MKSFPEGISQVWSMDFIHVQLEDSRSFRLFNEIDDFNRGLEKVRLFAMSWINYERPNMALGGIAPRQRLTMAA